VENPLVSVVIGTYNHKDFIAKTIESVLMQKTTFPIEIIVGEDESNDGTREICIEYANKYPGIIRLFLRFRKDVIYINNQPTGRYNFLENMKSVRGKYVALLPGDDYWTDPTKLQKQVDYLRKHPNCILTYHSWQNFIERDKTCYETKSTPRILTIVFRNVILEYPDYFYRVANGDTALRFLLKQHGKFAFVPGISPAMRRIHADGIMGPLSVYDKLKRRITTFKELREAARGTGREKEIQIKLSKYKINFYLLSFFSDEKVNGFRVMSELIMEVVRSKLYLYATKFLIREILNPSRRRKKFMKTA
jgi:glycosyltransferase involved in cell wall biosynthesis